MKIQVGVLGDCGGYAAILHQEKIPFVTADNGELMDTCSAIVVGDKADQSLIDAVRKYLADGASILCSGKVFHQLTSEPVSVRYIRSIFNKRNELFPDIDVVDVYADCVIPDRANALYTDHHKKAVYVGKYGDGTIIALPFDPGKMLLDDRSKAKSFYSPNARLPHEQVSTVSKGSIRRLITRSLEILHHEHGLPYAHLWYYPSGARTVFGIRIDTDFANEKEIEDVYRCAKKCGIPFSWFLHVASHEKFLSRFREMPGHEIGLHCYNHIRYEDKAHMMNDLERAMDVCRKAGIDPRSFVAAYGQWNQGIQQAIDAFHFEYSSEFSYDYDNLPSFPVVNGDTAATLQVPVHPISIGGLRRQGYAAEEMKKYIDRVFDRNVRTHTPMFWYHHPKNYYEEVLEYVIQRAQTEQLPIMNMIDYARWWKKRHEINMTMEVDGPNVKLDYPNAPDDLYLHVTTKDRKECFVPAVSAIDLNTVQWKDLTAPVSVPQDFNRIRKFNPRIPLNYMENKLSQILFPKP